MESGESRFESTTSSSTHTWVKWVDGRLKVLGCKKVTRNCTDGRSVVNFVMTLEFFIGRSFCGSHTSLYEHRGRWRIFIFIYIPLRFKWHWPKTWRDEMRGEFINVGGVVRVRLWSLVWWLEILGSVSDCSCTAAACCWLLVVHDDDDKWLNVFVN